MAGIPSGISTALVHLDAPISFIGDVGRIHATVTSNVPLVWAATGTPIGNFIDNVSLDPGIPLQLSLPHTDQDGFLDGSGNKMTGWYYSIEVTYERDGQTIAFPARDFQILKGQTNVDLALIPGGEVTPPVSAPVAVVMDVAGVTGSVSLEKLKLHLVDNTRDADKPVSKATAAELGKKADATTVSTELAKKANATTMSEALGLKADATAVSTALARKAPSDSPVFTGTMTGSAVEALKTVINIRDFGTIGDGIADDTAAIQAAINAAPVSGATLVIPPGRYRFTNVNLNKPNVNFRGEGGTLLDGTITIGEDSGSPEYNTELSRVRYDGRAAYNPLRSFIIMKRARTVRVTGCTIANTGKAISVPLTTTGFHTVAMLDIERNKFIGVDYAFHSETTAWDTVSDLGFAANNVNVARITPLWASGLDGGTISDNKLFQINYSTTLAMRADKRDGIYVGVSDQLHINDNNIFESGTNGIRLGSPANLDISGNHIVWPGQVWPADAILIEGGQPRGEIAGNGLVNFTRHAISITGGDPRRLIIGENMYRWLTTPESYFGTEPLPSTANRFRVYVPLGIAERPIIRDYSNVEVFDSIQGRFSTALDRKGEFTGVSGAVRRFVNVNSENSLILQMTDIKGLPRYGGLVVVHARSSGASESKIATYVLLVSYSGTQSQCVLLGSAGSTAGADATDPSFTFNIFGEHLRASPVGNTAGGFWIEALSLGAIAMR